MEEEKLQSKNLMHPSINDYLLLETWGEHDNGQENLFKKIYFIGEHDKGGNMAKGITVFVLKDI